MMGKRRAAWLVLPLFLRLISASENTNGTRGAVVLWECRHNFSNPSEAKKSRIYWQNDDIALHLYMKGEEKLKYQTESFKNRTNIFIDQIPFGNLSLALKLELEDDKKHVEVVIWDGSLDPLRVCQTTLNVAVPFQTPTIEINQTDMTATCKTRGFPLPEVKWTFWDESGQERTLEEYEISNTTTEDGLFNIITTANATGAKRMMCTFYNPTASEPVSNFTDIPAQGTEKPGWITLVADVVLGVLVHGVLVFGVLAAVVFVICRRRRQERLRNDNGHGEAEGKAMLPLNNNGQPV